MNESVDDVDSINVDEEGEICEICLDNATYEDNALLRCEKCKTRVHQSCYGVEEMPAKWLCEVCAAGGDPSMTECEICRHAGSALSKTIEPGKWVHGLCALWVPEVYSNSGSNFCFDLSQIDPTRYKIKCRLCTKRNGAIVQCSYGRCAAGAHPYCGVRCRKGFTHRIVKNPDFPESLLWEIFCKQHANAVYEPVKPKVKAKRTTAELELLAGGVDAGHTNSTGHARKGGKSTPANDQKPKRGRPRKHQGDEASGGGNYSSGSQYPEARRKSGRQSTKGYVDSDDSDEENALEAKEHQRTGAISVCDDLRSEFMVWILSEWPGQSEGEPIDLPHFWNVVSMMYPEQHSQEWLDYMLSPLLLNETNPFLQASLPSIPPPLGSLDETIQKLNEGHDDIFVSTLSERDFISLMDADKRIEFTAKINKLIESLSAVPSSSLASMKGPVQTTDNSCSIEDIVPNVEFKEGHCVNADGSSKAPTSSERMAETNSCCFDDSSITFLTRRKLPALGLDDPASLVANISGEAMDNSLEETESTLRVLFSAGNAGRVDCEYRVMCDQSIDDSTEVSEAIHMSETERLEALMTLFRDHGAIGPDTLRFCHVADTLVKSTRLELCSKSVYDNSLPVFLPDREIIAQEEEGDEMCEFMRHDQALLRQLAEGIASAITRTMATEPLHTVITEVIPAKKKHDEFTENVLTSYRHQRVWGSVCKGLLRGVRDQHQDFNQHKLEPLPASWAIKVEGRPLEVVADAEASTKDDAQVDAVCMCCFDGTSHDDNNNKILFCDGCNAAIHQTCYGVPEIPEGDFFCDRCEHIRDLNQKGVLYYEPEELKDVVKCCLCPVYHGALKRTTDGRWVHMCCAIFAKGSVITNLEDMSPIEVTGVEGASRPVLKRAQPGRRSVHLHAEVSVGATREVIKVEEISEEVSAGSLTVMEHSDASPVQDLAESSERAVVVSGEEGSTATVSILPDDECCVCGLVGGYMESCSHGCAVQDECAVRPTGLCSKRFHPLCGWFQGFFVETILTDSTYLGITNGGAFPSGLLFNHYCGDHTPPFAERTPTSGRGEQLDIRSKYIIDTNDLCCIPGRAPKRRKNKKKNNSAAAMKRVGGSQRAKDLNVDQYVDSMCAICIEPTMKILAPEDGLDGRTLMEDCVKCLNCRINVHKRCAKAHGFLGSTSEITSQTTTDDPDDKPSKEITAKISEDAVAWTCRACCHLSASSGQVGDKTDTAATEINLQTDSTQEELRCALCPRRGGVFTQVGEEKYAHCFCVDHKPARASTALTAKENKKQNCSYCNRRVGLCARCSHPGGCGQYFHPLCAARAGDSYICIRNGTVDQYCTHHIPSTVCRLTSGYWVDTAEVSRLRKSLDQARVILDQVLNREKTKKRMFRVMEEKFAQQSISALKRLERKLSASSADDDASDAGQDDMSDVASTVDLDDILPPSEVKHLPKKRGRQPASGRNARVSFDGERDDDDDTYENAVDSINRVAPTQRRSAAAASAGMIIFRDDLEVDDWEDEVLPVRKKGRLSTAVEEEEAAYVPPSVPKTTPGRKKKLSKEEASAPAVTVKEIPDSFRVELSGQKIDKSMTKRAGNSKEFHRIVRENLLKTLDDFNRVAFDSQRSFNEFERKLPKHVDQFLLRTTKDLAMEYDGSDSSAPASIKKKDKKARIQDEEVVVVNVPSSQSKRGSRKSIEAEAEVKVPDGSDNEGAITYKSETDQPPARKKGRLSQGRESCSSTQPEKINDTSFVLQDILTSASRGFLDEMRSRRHNFLTANDQAIDKTKGGFAAIVQTLCPPLLQYPGNDWGNDGGVCGKQDLVRLERNVATMLAFISSVRVPRSGVLGHVLDRGSEMKCWAAIRDRLNKGESVTTSRWWEKKTANGKVSDGKRNAVAERKRKPSHRKSKVESGYGTVANEDQKSVDNDITHSIDVEDDPYSRALALDYEEIPYDLVPEYVTLITHPLSLSVLRERLQNHEYRSFETFAADYYEMLSNGRTITQDGSQTWWDSYILAQLFAYLRGLLSETAMPNNVMFSATGKGQTPLQITKLEDFTTSLNSMDSSDFCVRECGICKCKYSLTGCQSLPPMEGTTKSSRPSSRSSTRSTEAGEWSWVCPECLVNGIQEKILGMPVKVWWCDDAKYYDGWVESFDDVSKEHRINYTDGEWEFLSLRTEEFLILIDSHISTAYTSGTKYAS